ncbi:MAG TPA: alpha/beta hydrolase [Bryobacteraceae bacterium]|nr:alpha/beta hydrolase [Bryobacteraceae bacterium]
MPRALQTFEFEECPIAYRIAGSGPLLVMIQGVGAQGTAPNPQIEILEPHYTCLTFDNRGIGASLPAGRPTSVGQMARDTLALMDHVGWRSAHLIGHSLGGLIALQAALTAHGRVRSLTLLCTFARGADARRLTPELLWVGVRVRFGWRSLRRRAFIDLVVPPGQRDGYSKKLADRISRVLGHDVADIPPVTDEQTSAMEKCDVTPRLGELAGIPALVISAEKDPIAPPSSGLTIAAGIPGAHYVEIAGASHSLPILEPERCGALTLEHLAEAERGFVARA